MTHFTIGQVVKVLDKRPKPPKHHSKKLKEWESNHFNGVVKEIRHDRGSIVIKNTDSTIPGMIEYSVEVSLSDSVRKIEPIKNQQENG